jgi:Domain of unknown function (DUF4091)
MRKFNQLVIRFVFAAMVVGLSQGALLSTVNVARAAPLTWWFVGSTVKVPSLASPPADPAQPLHLHAARQEYAPFQVVFQTDDSLGVTATLVLSYPTQQFDVKLYREQYFPLKQPSPNLGMFSLARIRETTLPDGLAPIKDKFAVPGDGVAVVWVDVFVRADTPPGDYMFTLASGSENRTVQITVYPVDLAPSAAMNVIVPLEPNWSIPFFAQGNPDDFHRNVNEMLVKHDLVPGTLVAQPKWTGQGWDFSPLDAELSMLPPGSSFFAPLPYDAWNKQYVIQDQMGSPYYRTNFDDPYFASQVKRYFQTLAKYLRSKGRLKTALIYPTDETRWVGDEPIHNGPDGFARLSRWTQFARAAGLRVIASGVTPVAQGLPSLGWPESDQVTDDSHVPLDFLDADPSLFADWMSRPGHSASIYLNEYGDLIDVPASLQRGLIWHAYARGIRTIAGYAALQWVDSKWRLVDPWQSPDLVFPQVGYGVGAILWPGPGPSLRLKVLREGVEDARLLDLYASASSPDQAVAIAACLTPGPLADQRPADDLWDRAHTALLAALANRQPVHLNDLCLHPSAGQDGFRIIDMDSAGAATDQWKVSGAKIGMVPSPFPNSGDALSVTFSAENNQIGIFPDLRDWSAWKYLEIDVQSEIPYFTELNVALTDAKGNYLMLRNGVALVGPAQTATLRLPLALPLGFKGNFDFAHVSLITLQANTVTQQTDGYGQRRVYPLGARSLIFDNFTLAR